MVQNSRKISRKNILLFLTALMFVTGTVSGQESQSKGNTQLKVIQLSPDAEPVDIFIDGEQVGNNIGFGDLVGVELETGRHTVRAESDNIELTRTVNLRQSRTYTLAINNRAIRPDMTLVSQDTTASRNQTRLRLAHFSPDLLTVNVELEDSDTFIARDLNYLETGEYRNFRPGTHTFIVRESRVTGTSFDSSVRLRPNRSYTGFIAGLKSGSTDQRLRIIPVSDRLERQIDEDEDENGNGNGNGNGETENGEIRKDFSLVCRFEESSSD